MAFSKSKYIIPKVNQKLYQVPRQHLAKIAGEPRLRRMLVHKDHYAEGERRLSSRITRIIFAIAALLLAQGVLHVPLLRLQAVDIQGLRYLPFDEVQSTIATGLSSPRFGIYRNDNYFLFSGNRIAQTLEKSFLVSVVKIEKKFPNKLTIVLRERIAPFVVQTPEKYQQLDTNGQVIGDVPGPQPSQSIIADERTDRTASITREYLELVTIIKDTWERTISDPGIAKFHLTDEKDKVTLSTNRGFRVYLDPAKDVQQQLNRLALFLQDKSITPPSEYVDLRFEETLFSK